MKKSLLRSVLMSGMLMCMSPQAVLSQTITINNNEGSIAREFEAPNEAEIIKRMQDKIQELMSLSMDDVEPATLATPDYDLVRKILQAKISDSLVAYFNELELINTEVKRTFSELLALKNYADKREQDPKGPLHQEYIKDLKLKIPALDKKINTHYTKAIKNLTTLQNAQPVAVRKNRDQFKDKTNFDYRTTLLQLCRSSLCVKTLTADILAWNEFAANFNQRIDFVNFTPIKVNTHGQNVRTTPFITNSLLGASKKLLDLGKKDNKEYSVTGVVAQVALDTVKVPSAIATALISIPVYLVEKPIRLLGTQSFTTMKLNLSMNSVEAYPMNQFKNSLYAWVDKISEKRTSAIYYSSSEEASKLRGVINDVQKLSMDHFKVNALDQFTNDELLDLVARDIYDLNTLLSKLSGERVLSLLDTLPHETQVDLLLQEARKTPSKIATLSFDLKKQLLEEETSDIAAFISFIEEDIDALTKSSSIIRAKYKEYQERPVPTTPPTSEFYTSATVNDDGSVSILKPVMYGPNANLVPLSSESSGAGVCNLYGFQNGGKVLTASGDHSSTAIIGVSGFSSYKPYSGSYNNRGIDTVMCFTKEKLISKNYQRLITNLDGTTMVVAPRFNTINGQASYFSDQSDLQEICKLYGYAQAVGDAGKSGDHSNTLIYRGQNENTSMRRYSGSYNNRGIDTITCR